MVKKKRLRSVRAARGQQQDSGSEGLLGRRIVAYVLDVVLLVLIIRWPIDGHRGFFGFWGMLWFGGLVGILSILYWGVTEYFFGQSLGKMVMGLRGGGSHGFWRFFIRNAMKVSSLLLLIDSWRVLFSKSQQLFTEEWSGTRVVRAASHGGRL